MSEITWPEVALAAIVCAGTLGGLLIGAWIGRGRK
jgi:hypothetical protein